MPATVPSASAAHVRGRRAHVAASPPHATAEAMEGSAPSATLRRSAPSATATVPSIEAQTRPYGATSRS